MTNPFVAFVLAGLRAMFRGSKGYALWLGFLCFWVGLGAIAYAHQLDRGLGVTALSDAIPWGTYIANFTYLTGIAGAIALLMVLAYAYRDEQLRTIVVLTELLAVAVVPMTLLFVLVDLGRPERAWHLLPMIGRFNWPSSMLAWDVILLTGYLAFNGYVAVYLAYAKYANKPPSPSRLLPIVWLAIIWALAPISAFLYGGLAARPSWNAGILAPRFLASALAAGPAMVILVLAVVQRYARFPVAPAAVQRLRQIAGVAMLADLFLYGSDVFGALYAGRQPEMAPFLHMFVGLHDDTTIVPYAWAGLALNGFAAAALCVRRLHERPRLLLVGCGAAVIGVWIEKGIGLLIPGFVPTTLGQVVRYVPSLAEVFTSAGIWALGALCYTLLVKAALPIELGQARYGEGTASARTPAAPGHSARVAAASATKGAR